MILIPGKTGKSLQLITAGGWRYFQKLTTHSHTVHSSWSWDTLHDKCAWKPLKAPFDPPTNQLKEKKKKRMSKNIDKIKSWNITATCKSANFTKTTISTKEQWDLLWWELGHPWGGEGASSFEMLLVTEELCDAPLRPHCHVTHQVYQQRRGLQAPSASPGKGLVGRNR